MGTVFVQTYFLMLLADAWLRLGRPWTSPVSATAASRASASAISGISGVGAKPSSAKGGVGVRGAAGRVVELGEGKRREKFVAACALSLRDGDRGSICVFGGADVRGIAFEQNVAAKAMQEGEGCKVRGLIRADQRFIDACDRAVRPQRLEFQIREKPLKKCDEEPPALIDQDRQRLSHFGDAFGGVDEPTVSPTDNHFGNGAPLAHPVLSAEILQCLGRDQGCCGIATQDFKN
jgi:hypothetical protein